MNNRSCYYFCTASRSIVLIICPFNVRFDTNRGSGAILSRSDTDDRSSSGSRVRMRRMMLGMTQADLSEAIGVTFQQVQK
jgi:hypothetical protein